MLLNVTSFFIAFVMIKLCFLVLVSASELWPMGLFRYIYIYIYRCHNFGEAEDNVNILVEMLNMEMKLRDICLANLDHFRLYRQMLI